MLHKAAVVVFAVVLLCAGCASAQTCTDPYEPNDSSAAAWGTLTVALPAPNVTLSSTYLDGRLCSATDEDWYKVDVPGAGSILLVANVSSGFKLKMDLYGDPSAAPLQTVTTGGVSDVVFGLKLRYSATAGGTYYLRVTSADGLPDPSSTYSLNYAFAVGQSPVPMAFPITFQNSGNTARVDVDVQTNGLETVVEVHWGTDPEMHYQDGFVEVYVGHTDGTYTLNWSGLQPSTTYYYRAVAHNPAGYTYDVIYSFTTGPVLPTPIVITSDISGMTCNINGCGVTLNGTVNPNGYDSKWWFRFDGFDQGMPWAIPAGSAPIAVSIPVSGLVPRWSYNFQLVATNQYGETDGEYKIFTAPTLPPIAITKPATNITPYSARLNCTIGPNGGPHVNLWFEYSRTPDLSNASVTPLQQDGTMTGINTADWYTVPDLSGLSSNTTYYFRVHVMTDLDAVGEILSFKTPISPDNRHMRRPTKRP